MEDSNLIETNVVLYCIVVWYCIVQTAAISDFDDSDSSRGIAISKDIIWQFSSRKLAEYIILLMFIASGDIQMY